MPCYPDDITSLRFQPTDSRPSSPQPSLISEDNLSEEQSQDMITGSSSSYLTRQYESPMSERSLDLSTPSSLGVRQRMNTYGRRRRELRAHNLNLVAYRQRETAPRIGTQSGRQQREETSTRYLPMLESDRTPAFEELATTTWTQLAWNESAKFTGVQLAQGSLEGPGARPVIKPTLKVTNFLIIDPRTKFWCGYNSHEHVVIDEFRGAIDIGHLLRWLDRYPVIVETKGGAVVFNAKRIWITSNLDPRDWFPTIDTETMNALLRRVRITHFNAPLQ